MSRKSSQSHLEPLHLDHLNAAPKSRRGSKEAKFDSLEDFEQYIKDETWENEYDTLNVHLNYLPPFIMKEIGYNEQNIKPSMNCQNMKFRKNLHQHLNNELIPEIVKMSGINYQFERAGEEILPNIYGTSNVYKWHYKDESNHGFEEAEYQVRDHWAAQLDVETTSTDPFVNVDFKCVRI